MSVFPLQKPMEEIRCRLSLFGGESVGKTKIVERLLQVPFNDEYTTTIEDYHELGYEFANTLLTVEIVDTSGLHQFPDMRKLNMQRSDIAVLVFDLTNLLTFTEVERLYGITREYSDGVVIIVGAKDDIAWKQNMDDAMVSDVGTMDVANMVLPSVMSHPEWKEFIEHFVDAQEDEKLIYISCSAKTGVNVDAIIDRGVSELHPEVVKRHANCPVPDCKSFTRHSREGIGNRISGRIRLQNAYSNITTFIKTNQNQVTSFIKDNQTQVTSFIKERQVIERLKDNQAQVSSFLKNKVNLQHNDGRSDSR